MLTAAFFVHAIMARSARRIVVFLLCNPVEQTDTAPRRTSVLAGLLLPLGWVFEPASDAWRQAAATRSFYFVLRWPWYEWLGVVAPLALLWWFRALAQRGGRPFWRASPRGWCILAYFSWRWRWLCCCHPGWSVFVRSSRCAFCILCICCFVLLSGGLLGQYVLKKHALRWLLLFVPLSAGMFMPAQMYPATPHLELPGATSGNGWVEAFRWISRNTPVDGEFALDPHYMELPGEDYHGFARWPNAACWRMG